MSKKDEVLENCLSKARLTWLSESTVAPFMGAWIETRDHCKRNDAGMVAPFMGAWIETIKSFARAWQSACRTLHGCVD